jgi:hypothetical protein
MFRPSIRLLPLLSLTLIALVPLVKAGAPTAPTKTVPLSARLMQTVEFSGLEADPKETLGEVLDLFTKRYGITFTIDDQAFKTEMVDDVRSKPVLERPLPRMNRVRLATLLHKLLARVPSQSGTTYLVRRDAIEITTMAKVAAEVWKPNYTGPFLPLLSVSFDKVPLSEALRQLADQSGFNVVLDARAAAAARTPVSMDLLNTPLDTAVGLLADSADLKPFVVDNLVYVTSRENAAKLQEERKKQLVNDPNEGLRIGSAPGVANPAAPPLPGQ